MQNYAEPSTPYPKQAYFDYCALRRITDMADSNAHDLLHEALALMLDGDRCAWSTETFWRDLRGIIRSVASHRRESLKQRQQRELEYTNAQPPTSNGQEGQVDSVSRVQHIRDYFEAQGDVEAALVIDGMAQGLSMREAAETLGLSSTQYDAIRQRIRRQRGNSMSSNKISDQEALNVLEALADSVGDMSDVEILEEFRREGRDPEVDAKELQQGLIAFVTSHQRQVLREQHTQAHQKITRSERSLPESSAARRILLRRALEKAPPGLTVQGRNLEEIPDDELVSWLIELTALGCLPDEE